MPVSKNQESFLTEVWDYTLDWHRTPVLCQRMYFGNMVTIISFASFTAVWKYFSDLCFYIFSFIALKLVNCCFPIYSVCTHSLYYQVFLLIVNVNIFWVIPPCWCRVYCRHFGGHYCLLLGQERSLLNFGKAILHSDSKHSYFLVGMRKSCHESRNV
jgi:hypothetical protein